MQGQDQDGGRKCCKDAFSHGEGFWFGARYLRRTECPVMPGDQDRDRHKDRPTPARGHRSGEGRASNAAVGGDRPAVEDESYDCRMSPHLEQAPSDARAQRIEDANLRPLARALLALAYDLLENENSVCRLLI